MTRLTGQLQTLMISNHYEIPLERVLSSYDRSEFYKISILLQLTSGFSKHNFILQVKELHILRKEMQGSYISITSNTQEQAIQNIFILTM